MAEKFVIFQRVVDGQPNILAQLSQQPGATLKVGKDDEGNHVISYILPDTPVPGEEPAPAPKKRRTRTARKAAAKSTAKAS